MVKKRLLILILIATLSSVISVLLVILSLNYYLGVSGQAKESLFLKWTLINARYSPKYVFWDYSHCKKQPENCNYPEEQHTTFPVEIFEPQTSAECNDYIKILFLGDSFTVSPWTQEGESFPAVFSNKYALSENKCVQMYRFASAGTGNDQQLAAFLDLKDKLNPDTVIWQFYFNDFPENVKVALYDPVNQSLKKRFVWTNTVFLAGFLNQNVPFLSSTTLGKHLMYMGEENDIFKNWPISPHDEEKLVKYNSEKITLMLGKMQSIANADNFSFYTTLAPLECKIIPSIPCNNYVDVTQESMRHILLENSRYVAMDHLVETQSVLGLSFDEDFLNSQDYLFNTDKDINTPGSRHLSNYGNQKFGSILFDNFTLINSFFY